MKTNKNWWEGIEVESEPMSHIPEKRIAAVMPDDVKPQWENWLRGQTGLHCEDGDFGVYSWDWDRFVSKLERSQPLVDTAEEWD